MPQTRICLTLTQLPTFNSDDVLRYSQSQLDNARAMWDRLNKRYPTKGESYSELSELFNKVFFHYLRTPISSRNTLADSRSTELRR